MAEVGILETNGLSDRTLYAQVMTNLRNAYDNYGVGDGNYPKAEGILTDRILENIWMKNILDAKTFIDGLGITSRTGGNNCSSVRIPLMAPPRWSMRTLSIDQCINGKLTGTPGNDGLENRNLPQIPQTNGVDLPLNQLYDDATIIYQLSQDMVSLPIAAEYTAQIPGTVANMEDTTVLAVHAKGALVRASGTENSNVIEVDLTSTSEGYFQGIMNKLIGIMRNPQTSWSEGIVQYDLKDSVIVMKESFWDIIFSVKNGALVNASNLAQSMLLGGAFTENGKPLGNNTWGIYSGVPIKVVPDSYWRQAAAISGITSSNYEQYSKIQAYIANAKGFAFGRASAQINPIPNPGNAIGTKIQNLSRWGAAMVRPSAAGVVISGSLNDFTNPFTEDGNIVAPADINGTIKSYGFTNADYGNATKIGVKNEITAVTLTLNDGGSPTPTAVTDAEVTVRGGDGTFFDVKNNGDGTYSFNVFRLSTATVGIVAEGFENATVSISTSDTAGATKAITKSLIAE